MEHADGTPVAIIDADVQDPPEVLLQMLQLWEQGYEVVFGVRKTRAGESWFKLKTADWFYRNRKQPIRRMSGARIMRSTSRAPLQPTGP